MTLSEEMLDGMARCLKFKSEKKTAAQANLSQNDLLQIGEKGTNFKCTLSLAEICWFWKFSEFMKSKISKKCLKLILQIYQVEVANRET